MTLAIIIMVCVLAAAAIVVGVRLYTRIEPWTEEAAPKEMRKNKKKSIPSGWIHDANMRAKPIRRKRGSFGNQGTLKK